ncbi:MAG: glycine dehydrogenase (aminomethyl-transferring), partial [Acidimicrobiia bacterium]|nr:glycine dehydrogenase (aminomethyl-transferring) [Acidimicrobiia bacterium]
MSITIDDLPPLDAFAGRHTGPNADDVASMLDALGYASLDALIDTVVPADIRMPRPLDMPDGISEQAALARLREFADQNVVARSYLGMGYYGTVTPPVILRNILENPGWYTAYTPYQPEIAQGRLEALLNFQTVVSDLTGLDIANASLLDEATAVAEAVTMTNGVTGKKGPSRFLVDERCHPQTIAVVQTRARVQGITIDVANVLETPIDDSITGVVVQYPDTEGAVRDFGALCAAAHDAGALVTAATDLLSLTLLTPPGEWGADIAVGSAQRFGVPMGFGGPHAAFFATREDFKRHVPGRIIGVS